MNNNTIDVVGLSKKLKHKAKQSSRKANKQLAKGAAYWDTQNLGAFHYATNLVGLIPHNTRKGTDYLVEAGTVGIVIKTKGWWMFYLTNARIFDSIEQVKAECKHVKALRSEIKLLNRPVKFRDAATVAFKQMLPENWVADVDYRERVNAFYPVSVKD